MVLDAQGTYLNACDCSRKRAAIRHDILDFCVRELGALGVNSTIKVLDSTIREKSGLLVDKAL